MRKIVFNLYRFIFGREIFYKYNKYLLRLVLRSIGFMNYENDSVSGESFFLRETIKRKKKPIIFDIGANIGDYTKKCISINRNSTIHCFEPHPITFDRLKYNLKQNKNTIINNLGVSNYSGKIKLYDYEEKLNGSQHATLIPEVIEQTHRSKSKSFEIQTVTIDSYIVAKKIKNIDLLKIDVEGNELNVLLGAKKSMKKGIIKVIQFEFTQINTVNKVFVKDFFELLSQDYKIYRLLPKGKVYLEKYVPLHEIFAYQNFVAVLR